MSRAKVTTALGAAVVGVAATLLVTPAAATATPCPDVELIFARGTSEDPGLGRVGTKLESELRAKLPDKTLTTYSVTYPATWDFLAAQDGALDAQNRIVTMSSTCPDTRLVLGGYSQGAAIMDMLMGVPPLGDKIGAIGSAPPLPATLRHNIAAIAVFGNPSTKFSKPITIGQLGNRSIDLCSDGDPICSRGRNPFAHTNYEDGPMVGQAAEFAANLI